MAVSILFQRLDPKAQIPKYQTEGSSGFDFHALENVVIKKGEVTLVRTGLSVEIPKGYELQVRARSGLAAKHGIFLVNGIGTIDSDYRGEIKIILSSCGDDAIALQAGDRIAQGVVCTAVKAQIVVADSLSETQRADGGFGSTGIRPS